MILFVALHEEGVKLSVVLDYMELTPLAARQHLQRLVDIGYFEIKRHPTDHRAKLVKLTAGGRGKVAHLESVMEKFLAEVNVNSTILNKEQTKLAASAHFHRDAFPKAE